MTSPDTSISPGSISPGTLGGSANPYSKIAALLVVQADAEMGWITDVNALCCQLVGWTRGSLGDARDPGCVTQSLIGKPLDVLVPPRFRAAHRMFRRAFMANPEPRTMGEGRNTPIWIREADQVINGLESIRGTPATVLIGLSAMDEHHTLAMIQPMTVGKSFTLPEHNVTSSQL